MSCYRTFQGNLFTKYCVLLPNVNRFQNSGDYTVLLFIISINSRKNIRNRTIIDFSDCRNYFMLLGYLGYENWKFQHTT